MQIWTISTAQSLFLSIALWFIFQYGSARLSLLIPERFLSPNNLFLKPSSFEKHSNFYHKILKIKKWKHLLPDGATVWKDKSFTKRYLQSKSPLYLNQYTIETVRGEIAHWAAIFPFWVFGFFLKPYVVWIMFLYALIVNLPCILVLRYNRMRILRLLEPFKERS